MPSIQNNKGIALVPFLIVGTFFSVLGLFVFNNFGSLSNVLQSTTQSKSPILVDANINNSGSGTVTISALEKNEITDAILNNAKTKGISVSSYYFNEREEKNAVKMVKPRITEKGLPTGVLYRLVIPVTWKTEYIELLPRNNGLIISSNSISLTNNASKLWRDDGYGIQNTDFSADRTILITPKSISKNQNSETIEFKVTGSVFAMSDFAKRLYSKDPVFRSIKSELSSTQNYNSNNDLKIISSRYTKNELTVRIRVPSNISSIIILNIYDLNNYQPSLQSAINGWELSNQGREPMLKRTVSRSINVSVTQVGIRNSTDVNLNFVVKGQSNLVNEYINSIKSTGYVNYYNDLKTKSGTSNTKISFNQACGNTLTVGCRFSIRVPQSTSTITLYSNPLNVDVTYTLPARFCSQGSYLIDKNNEKCDINVGGR